MGAVRTNSRSWSDDKIDRLCALRATNMSTGDIAHLIGETRNAVAGQLHRMQQAGDPRVPPPMPKGQRRRSTSLGPLDRLAELMAEGCPTLAQASRTLNTPVFIVQAQWGRICAALGPQAV